MDKIDPRYKRGKVYCVRCRYDDDLCYVGSTIQTLAKRMAAHRKDKLCSLYKYVNDDWDNWFIELYEYYPCNNKPELDKREGQITRQIGNINKSIAGRTKKEYYYDNRDKCLEQRKQYREDNLDKILEYQKEYRQDNREKLLEKAKQYHQVNREKILEDKKQYHRDNREKRLEYNKQRYEDNREKLLEQAKQKITCDRCGSIVNKYIITRHKKTQKCINFKPA